MKTKTKQASIFSGRYFYVLLAMCGLSCCAYGIISNSAGIFFEPIASEFAVGKGAVSMTLTVSGLASAIAGLFVPKFLKEKSWRKTMIVAFILIVLSTVGMAFSNELWLLYVTNGVRGIGAGLISYVTISLFVNQWFYAKHGFVTSLTMCFSGISGAILSPVFTAMIDSFGWRTTYLLSLIFIVLFFLPAILLPYTLYPKNSQMTAYGQEERKEAAIQQEESPAPSVLTFILICIVSLASNCFVGVVQHLPSYAVSLNYPTEAGALMLSLALIGNIGSKLVIGILADRIGTRNAIWTLTILNILSILLLMNTQSVIVLYIGSLLIGCGFGVGAVGITLMTKSLFGIEAFVRVYPFVSFLAAVSFSVATFGIGCLYDWSGNYELTLQIAIGLCVIVFLATLFAYRKQPSKD